MNTASQFYGAILSTCLVAVSLLCYDWQMALAALCVLPITLVIVGFSKRAQNYFTRRQNAALISMADGVQECLETICYWERSSRFSAWYSPASFCR